MKRGCEASVGKNCFGIGYWQQWARKFIELYCTLTQISEPAPDTLQFEPKPVELPTKPTVPMLIEPFGSGVCPLTEINAIAVMMRLSRPNILDQDLGWKREGKEQRLPVNLAILFVVFSVHCTVNCHPSTAIC